MVQRSRPRLEPPASPMPSVPRKKVTVADLMQGAREIIALDHRKEYLVRITKTGKLIFTK